MITLPARTFFRISSPPGSGRSSRRALDALEAEGYLRGSFKLLVRRCCKWRHSGTICPLSSSQKYRGGATQRRGDQGEYLGPLAVWYPRHPEQCGFIGVSDVPYVELPEGCPDEVINGLLDLRRPRSGGRNEHYEWLAFCIQVSGLTGARLASARRRPSSGIASALGPVRARHCLRARAC